MSGDEVEVLESFENEVEMSEEENSDKELTEEELAEMAEKLKEQGNVYYKNKEYKEAAAFYSSAINACPAQASYYSNRAAAYMMINKYKEALEDTRQCIAIDPSFAKGHLREGKCHLALGEPAAALNSYNTVLTLEPNNNAVRSELKLIKTIQESEEMADRNFIKGDFRAAAFYMSKCIENSPACPRFKIRKAEALALNGKYQDSQEIVNDILRLDSMNADAIYVRGMCLYYQDNVEKAFQHFQHVFRLAPDHQKAKDIYKKAKHLMAKKEAGNTAFRSGRYEEAITLYTEALSIDSNNKITNSKLYCNRATVCSKVGKNDQAVEDCTKAIELDDTYLKAYLRRAKCYMDMEQYEEAVRNYEKIFQLDKSRENKQLLQEAKLELKKSKRKDYYKILGVSKTATDDEMKKAYRKRALIHHPDRHSHAEPEVQKEEEKKFKEVGEAYAVLSDQKKRSRYDSGQDLEEMNSGGFGTHIDPNEIFFNLFGGGGGGGFQHAGGHGGGFPGGFSFQFG